MSKGDTMAPLKSMGLLIQFSTLSVCSISFENLCSAVPLVLSMHIELCSSTGPVPSNQTQQPEAPSTACPLLVPCRLNPLVWKFALCLCPPGFSWGTVVMPKVILGICHLMALNSDSSHCTDSVIVIHIVMTKVVRKWRECLFYLVVTGHQAIHIITLYFFPPPIFFGMK